MAADFDQKIQVGFRGPSSIPIQNSAPFGQNMDPSRFQNQLQFNMQTPYSINSLASNFTKPCPLLIEKVVPIIPSVPLIHKAPIPSSPASSISSSRLHFAVQLAKMDAKRIKDKKEMKEYAKQNEEVSPTNMVQYKTKTKATGVYKFQELKKPAGSSHNDKFPQHKLPNNKGKQEKDDKRTIHGYHFYPDPDHTASVDKQTKEIRRLEKQMQKYLEKLDELINKGRVVIQKKDRRFHKDDVSHLSDDDTDPRQFKRADEQATRSARVLYMIERQIRELDDEFRKKGKNTRQGGKSQTLSRLAAAQRATVRALQMLINSAPLQPKGSHHYPLMYQELSSLIEQLSVLSVQLESDSGAFTFDKKPQIKDRGGLPSRPYQNRRAPGKELEKPGRLRDEKRTAFYHESTENIHKPALKNISSVTEIHPDDSVLTVDPTPERSATLKAGLEALLRAKQHEQHEQMKSFKKPANIASSGPTNTKKKAVLLPSSLETKRRKANLAVQKTIKLPVEAAHFTKETTASRLKKVDKQRFHAKTDTNEEEKGAEMSNEEKKPAETTPGPPTMTRYNKDLHEKEIQRQMWLEEETKRKLREVMDIPQQLVSEAEEAIKTKLKPLLDQAQVVVDSAKTKPIQERFVDLASNVTMKESETLSEMILDDLLVDTAEEFQRLEESDADEILIANLQDSSTLENILQRLEQFEKEEESIRRHLTHVTYDDPRQSNFQHYKKEHPEIKPIAECRREPQPIVIESTTLPNKQSSSKDKRTTQFPRLDTVKGAIRYSNTENSRLNVPRSTYGRPNYLRTQPKLEMVKSPVPVFLPSEIRENIFSYRQRYCDYLEETNTQHHGTFNPWKVVETLSDDILDEVLTEVAEEFCGACDDVTELIFQSEFAKE